GHEPRSRKPGNRHAQRAPTSNHHAPTNDHHAPNGDQRRGPPDTPTTSPASLVTLPFAASSTATAPHAEQ
ncbi:MAG: hypothetical protein OXE75_10815, partial [bacterium]|nr:hypothetical protein [bacterium]